MLSIKENFLEVLHGGTPDRSVKQYEFMDITLDAPRGGERPSPGKHIDALVLSAGTCTICPECTYPENPCRYPDKQMVSVEAAGIVVTELCQLAGLPYYYGSDKIAYIGCVLVERKENVD